MTLVRVFWPSSRAGVPWSIDLAAAGVLGMLLGHAVLWRRAQRSRSGWLVAVVAYGVAMPLALLAVIVMAAVFG